MALLFFISLFLSIILVSSLDNGLARSPPLGWRSWNAFKFDINQQLIQGCLDALIDKSRTDINGVPTSLVEIGYNGAGVDDGWQLCDSSGGYWHNDTTPNGWPVVNTDLFPDISSMVQYAHNNKLGINWYMNNCHCAEQNKYPANEANDVKWLRLYDLDGVKLDGCGSSMNTSNWNKLINETSNKAILTEDGGNTYPPNNTKEEDCPMNMYNFAKGSGSFSSYDHDHESLEFHPYCNYPSLISSFQGILPFIQGYPTGYLSYPGCWAFPGDLQLGNFPNEYASTPNDMDQTHFSVMSIVSSPLVLGFPLANKTIMDRVWPIITNSEVLSISQTWHGHPGREIDYSSNNCTYKSIVLKCYQIWAKPQPSNKWGVLLMSNDGYHSQNITVQFKDIPWNGTSANLRDIVNHKDLGSFSNSYTAHAVPPFGSVFLLFS